MLKHLKLVNVGPAPVLEMEFGQRLNILTGDNGLGKSFLLDVAWWTLTRRWPRDLNHKLTSGYPARPSNPKKPATIEFTLTSKTGREVCYSSSYVPREEAWTGRAGRPWNPGLVIYAHADGSFSVWDPARNYWKRRGNVDVQERVPGYVFSPQEVWDGLDVDIEGRVAVVCNGLIRDWAGWIKQNGSEAKRMASLLHQLSSASGSFDALRPGPLTRLSLDDARDIPSISTSYLEMVPILHASAGVRRIVALAYMLLWSLTEHAIAAQQLGESRTRQVIMLFDELESHLHPRWQRTILRALLDVVKVIHRQARIQLITATHSPLVLASTEPFFDATTDAWFDLDLENQAEAPEVVLTRRDYVRHGDVSNWLTSNAFDLKSARSIEAEAAIESARALLRERNPSLEGARKVDSKLREAGLPDIDPFWVRWGAFMERLGGHR